MSVSKSLQRHARFVIRLEIDSVPLLQVDIGFFADDVGVSPAHTLDLSQGVHDFALAIHVGVQQTQDVLYHSNPIIILNMP